MGLKLVRIGHGSSSPSIARKEQDGTFDPLNSFAPGRWSRNQRDIVEHVQVELCLCLQVGHQLFFRPVKGA